MGAAICLAAALATSWALIRIDKLRPTENRAVNIDGLRGYLAIFVFFHHCAVWYFYLRSGHWQLPPSHLYKHLGQTSVSIFFMITGYLFFSKLRSTRAMTFDWKHLYRARIARLLPLYLAMLAIMFLIIAVDSHGELRTSLSALALSSLRWIGFTVFGAPDVNGLQQTFVITAGVTWSLTYEWLFYLSLPLVGLGLAIRVPLVYLLMSLVAVAVALLLKLSPVLWTCFAVGFACSVASQSKIAPKIAASRVASLAAVACLVIIVWIYPTIYTPLAFGLLSLFFLVVACGNPLFGTLVARPCRLLGDLSYSIYLLHGIFLYAAFVLLMHPERSMMLTPVQHWLVCALCTPLLVLTSFATHRLIELPAMHFSSS